MTEDHATWSTAFVNTFPDSSFAWIEPGGKKDKEGRTVPRSYRHLPYKDNAGKIDLPHVRNALARMGQVKDKDGKPISDTTQGRIRKMLSDILEKQKEEAEFGKPSLTKCMDCSQPPEIEVLWADGRGRAWFCDVDFVKWLQSESDDKGLDIIGLHKVDGEVTSKWDSSLPNSWESYQKRADIKTIMDRQKKKKKDRKPERIYLDGEKEEMDHAVAKPFGHPAGQMLQSRRIISMIPEHSTFVEPFCGSATIFFSKDPTDGDEVLNDLNKDYVKALKSLKSLKDHEIKVITKKRWTGSAGYYSRIKNMTPPSDKVGWLHWFLYKTTFSFGSMGKSFDSSDEGHTCTLNQAKRYEKIRERMKNAIITSTDWAECIRQYDAEDTFFYIDPPYYSAKDKRASSFKIGEVNLKHFVDILKSIKGKFIASIGNEPEWIKALKEAGFHIQKITSPRSIPSMQKGDKKSTADWPLVSNFPMKIVSRYEDNILDEILNFDLEDIELEFHEYGDTKTLPSQRPPYNDAHRILDSEELTELLILQAVETKALKEGYMEVSENKTGTVTPMTFFKPLVSTPAYMKDSIEHNMRGLVDMVTRLEDFYPAISHENFGGARVQIHKTGKDVKMFSVDGQDVSGKFPSIVKEVKKMRATDLVFDASISGWEDGYKSGKYLDIHNIRSYINDKSSNNDSSYYATIFDILYIDMPTYESKIQLELHDIPTKQRMTYLEAVFKRTDNLDKVRMAETKNINNSTELIESAKYFSRDKGSDGAIFKSMRSIYQLTGHSKLWVNYVEEMAMSVQVVEIHKVKDMDHTFRYLTAVRTPQGKSVITGMTQNTVLKPNKGDLIRVAFTNMDMFNDPDSKDSWYDMTNARLVSIIRGRTIPDTSVTAERLATATKGETEEKPIPASYKDALKESENFQQDPKFSWQKRTTGDKTDYHLSLDFPNEPGLRHFHVFNCPLEHYSVRAVYAPMKDKKMMTLSGDVPPKSRFNPDNETSHYKLVEKEKPVEIIEWLKNKVTMRFHGSVIKGQWSFHRKGDNEWVMEAEEGSSISKCGEEHSSMVSMEFDVRSSKPVEGHPNFLEISGLYFHRGLHKGNTYLDEHLKKMKLNPRPGQSLVYTNWYHNKTEYYRAGIMVDLWWDPDVTWIDKANHTHGKGGVMYRSIITNPKAIQEINDKQIKNHSAELHFNPYYIAGVKYVKDIDGIGQGLTSFPALMAADIGETCTIDSKSGERVCE